MSNYERQYLNTFQWVNYPQIITPLSEVNLNAMTQALSAIDSHAYEAINSKAEQSEVNGCINGISFNNATGVITVTKGTGDNQTTSTIETNLAKIVTNWSFNNQTQKMILTLSDGTTQEVDLSAFITNYEFIESPFISFTMGQGTGGKNKLKITATSTTVSGITYTVNADGTVTANGTALADSSLALTSAALATTAESVLSGCPDGGGSDTYFIAYGSYADEGETDTIDSGESETPTITIKSGVEVENLVFKPMLCTSADYTANPAFIPYLESGAVYAIIKKGSITPDCLEPDYLAQVTNQKSLAQAAATLAESYAKGGTNTRTGEDNDNAKIYAQDAEAWASGKRNGTNVVSTDPTYHNNSEYFKDQAEAAAQTATSVIVDFTGATTIADGAHGLVPKPLQNANPQKQVLRSDGTWGTIEAVPNGGTTGQLLAKHSNTDGDAEWINPPAVFTGATTSADGEKGLVPKPTQNANVAKQVLKADGTWGTIETLPNGGTTGQALVKHSNTDGDAEWKTPKNMSGLESVAYHAAVGGTSPLISDPYIRQSDVDDTLNLSSTNPIQNGAVKAEFAKLFNILIPNNSGAKNKIYRGESLGTALTADQLTAIRAGTFDDLFLGDYWTINSRVWRIVDFDYWLGCGDTEFAAHHAVVIPDEVLYTAKMNDTDTTTGGYVGSKMYTTNLETAKTTVNTDFGSSNVLTHREYFNNSVTNGVPSGGTWYDSKVDLPNECMMYGHTHFSTMSTGTSMPFIQTISKTQLALFAVCPKFINPARQEQWLRDVMSASNFAVVGYEGRAVFSAATGVRGVRPAIAIG